MRKAIFATALVTLGLLTLGLGIASAQDIYKVNYFSNANTSGAPDATVRIDNPGVTYDLVCAFIYVFDNDQQLSECCGCKETPDGLRTLSVNKDLTSNPLTGVKSTNGVIKVVSGINFDVAPCDPTTDILFGPNVRVWATHIQNKVGSAFPITETESSNSAISDGEAGGLESQCLFVNILGSGHGICSCGTGD